MNTDDFCATYVGGLFEDHVHGWMREDLDLSRQGQMPARPPEVCDERLESEAGQQAQALNATAGEVVMQKSAGRAGRESLHARSLSLLSRSYKTFAGPSRYMNAMQLRGIFEIKIEREPALEEVDGVSITRFTGDKRFQGELEATSRVHMLAAATKVKGSAAYVAIERISGSVAGRSGTFLVAHLGFMRDGKQTMQLAIIQDSGTAELSGISGTMEIQMIEGQHHYTLDCNLPS